MAMMLPSVDPGMIEHHSEETVYIALRDGLPNDFVVLHSYPWLRPWRGEDLLLEGEADFVVLHPAKGLLVLEVKGGETIRLEGRRWFRDTRHGSKEFQDPFNQARRNMHALLDIIQERAGGKLPKPDFVHGYAVVFPHMDYHGKFPANADEKILLCHRHLAFIEQSLDVAYKRWGNQKEALSGVRYCLLLNECLMPKFGLFRPVGPTIDLDNDKLLELTETQRQVFEGLYAQSRVLVEGAAGSGKTILALHRALAFAREGKRTLFVCFNKDLANWLERIVEEDQTHATYRDNITIRNFHKLASEFARQAEIAFQPVAGGQKSRRFWDEEAPDLLEQAIEILEAAGRTVRYEALVVDEAQDFLAGWWYALLAGAIADLERTPVYAFLDPNQALRGDVEAPPVEFQTRFALSTNCRNTKRIARTSAAVLKLDTRVFKSAPSGQTPRILRAKTEFQQKGLVMQEVHKLLTREDVRPGQLALIGATAQSVGSLADLDDIAGVSLVSSVEAWRDGEGMLVTTARSFKGLEADVVVLYDLFRFTPVFTKMDLYVACTRAKHLLIVVTVDGEVRRLIEQSVSAADGEDCAR